MGQETILVVDDETDILELVHYNLSRDRFRVDCATSGEEALVKIKGQRPDLILLDIMLPDRDGLDVCRELKANALTRDIPVVMLTAKSEDADIVTGFELGADDYITKPFSPRVLLARVKAVLRRKRKPEVPETSLVKVGLLAIDPVRFQVRLGDRSVELTVSEFRILHFLARRPGWVYSREQIITSVKGDDYPVTDRSVDVQIVGLRKKLGECGYLIETVRGVGYRFRDE